MKTNFPTTHFRTAGAQSSGEFNPGHTFTRDSYLRKSGSLIPSAQKLNQVGDDGAQQMRRDRKGEVFKLHSMPRGVSNGTRVHLYAPGHYNKRGRVIAAPAFGPLTIRLDSGAEIQVPACDCEAC